MPAKRKASPQDSTTHLGFEVKLCLTPVGESFGEKMPRLVAELAAPYEHRRPQPQRGDRSQPRATPWVHAPHVSSPEGAAHPQPLPTPKDEP